MESKNITKDQRLYSLKDLSDILGVSVKSVRNRLSDKGLKRVKCEAGKALFSDSHLDVLRLVKFREGKPRKNKTEVYYIYQSKINNS